MGAEQKRTKVLNPRRTLVHIVLLYERRLHFLPATRETKSHNRARNGGSQS